MDLTPILIGFAQNAPWAMTILLIVGVLRAINKPLLSLFRAFVQATPSTSDDAVLDRAEASAIYKGVTYVLDWFGSVKIGPQVPPKS